MRATSNVLRELRLAVDDQAGLGGGAAHVEAQQAILAEAAGEPAAGEGTGSRARLDEADRSPGGVVGGHDTAVRQHHQHRAAEAFAGEPLLQLVEVRTDHRHRRRVARGGDHARVLADLRRDLRRDAHRHTELAAQVLGDHALVGRVGVRVDQAHADGLDVGGAQRVGDGRGDPRRRGRARPRPCGSVRSAISTTRSRGTGGAGNSICRSYMS